VALSNDQKAMLKLVAQPDTSYEDIAALMGLSVAEVRAKVDAALAELDQAAPAAEEKPLPPEPPEPKEEPKAKEEPKPEKPALPPPPPAEKPKPAPKGRPSAGKPKIKLPDDRGARYALFAGIAVVIVLVLLLVTGVLGGDDDSTEPATTAGSGAETGENQPSPTQAVLAEVGDSGVSGRAVFGRAGKNVALAVRVTGLDQAPAGHFYVISIATPSGEQAPLVASLPNKANEIVGNFKIKPQNLGYLGSGYTEMKVSLVATKEFATAIKSAQKSQTGLKIDGPTVASGEVTGPVIEIAEKVLEKEKEGG
jgi:hypothetical protein